MIRMQMSKEQSPQVFYSQAFDAFFSSGSSASDNSGSTVNHVRNVINNHSYRWSRALWISIWRPRTKQYDLSFALLSDAYCNRTN